MIADLRSSIGEARRPKPVLPWAFGGENDWRNAANDWVDGEI